ncbi:MAG: hypothetical protein IH789_11120 [Acidobacteria bacterium]|nr:hypothetical protein [Acidobacteriota bacterium]
MQRTSVGNLDPGDPVEAGQTIARVGPYPENGDWPPHLHFQIMTDLLAFEGEFPGVAVDIPAVTRQVWRHGFHAVIKAPFRLRAGRGRFSVEHALDQVIDEIVAFRLPRLRLAVERRFRAVGPYIG